ncbi:MAG: tetratricopeptide repeat protein [Candidatus Eisenbacteria bacterium]|uniref:Tetratricopeptide repeat protein n=1 Tax=Eiseniibacteriota bacterium TaxID=2212470 RepID=A0A933WAS9_UNCEI|nr:tetratricopeptide repeat protein [Candidatus Eisenbacteria bacterium]
MSLSRLCRLVVFALLLSSPASALPPALPRADDPAVQVFLTNDLERALPMLQKSARQSPRDADALAWLASCQRRLGKYDEAERSARRALALDPRHAFAEDVLGDTYNPVYSGWERTNAESTWTHLLRSVECDSTSCDAWPGLWIQAMERGDLALEKRSLRAMVSTGFLTPGLLAYARWVIRSLPERAVIVCNGDMDTYPLVALQETEALRPDVAVLNVGMLDLAWYRRFVRARHALVLAGDDSELPPLPGALALKGVPVVAHQLVMGAWLEAVREARFGRPLTVALGLQEDAYAPGTPRREVFRGPFGEHVAGRVEADIDTARVRASFDWLDRAAAGTSYVGARDHSPIRRAYTEYMRDNIADLAKRYADEVRRGGDETRTREAREWALQIARETHASADLIRALSPRGGDGSGKE